jgi:dienelactone hydrolase
VAAAVLGLVAAVALAAALALRFGPALGLSLSLAAPPAERWLGAVLEQPAREEIAIATASGPLSADLYRPAHPRGALLLVHGLSRAGRRQPDLARLAGLLGRHGVLVVVPQFEGMAAFRLGGAEVDEVAAAFRHTVALHPSAGIAGFSVGAGPALLAAVGQPGLRVVGAFGGYADLRHVIRYVTTGTHDFEGRRYAQRQEEYNRWKLLALLAGLADGDGDRRRLDDIARERLADPARDTKAMEAALGHGGRAVLALVLNREDGAVDALIAGLPEGARAALARLSPLSAVPRISARLVIAHGEGDDSIPFTESLRLARAAGGRAHLALFETFHHTGPQPLWASAAARGRDGWRLLRVAEELLPR